MAAMKQKKTFFLMAACAGIVVGAAPAFAGFEFKPPAGAEAAAAAPVASATMAPITPGGSIQWDAPGMPAQKVQGIEAVPLAPSAKGGAPVASAPVSALIADASDNVSGFGKDLPLSIALQQVVPVQYKVSFGKGVKMDALVSWTGDRPWKQVLTDMLEGTGLSYKVQGTTLEIAHAGGGKAKASRTAKAAPVPATDITTAQKVDMIPDDMMAMPAPVEVPAPVAAAAPVKAPEKISMITRREAQVTPPAPVASAPAAKAHAEAVVTDTSDMTPIPDEASTVASAAKAAQVIAPAWQAEKGQTLRAALEAWARAAHAELYWSTDYDYRLNENVALSGNFDEAVGKLLDRFAMVKPQPYARLHRNPAGSSVLIVNTYN